MTLQAFLVGFFFPLSWLITQYTGIFFHVKLIRTRLTFVIVWLTFQTTLLTLFELLFCSIDSPSFRDPGGVKVAIKPPANRMFLEIILTLLAFLMIISTVFTLSIRAGDDLFNPRGKSFGDAFTIRRGVIDSRSWSLQDHAESSYTPYKPHGCLYTSSSWSDLCT